MDTKILPFSFQGLKIEGVVASKNIKKLGEFANATENLGFIKDLETNFSTDMVLSGNLDEISFSHQIYGNLTKFGCSKFPVKDFYSQVVGAMDSIKLAIKKAEKDFDKSRQKYDSIRRGC